MPGLGIRDSSALGGTADGVQGPGHLRSESCSMSGLRVSQPSEITLDFWRLQCRFGAPGHSAPHPRGGAPESKSTP